ncbi:hypothetical protein LTR62_001305 [Meristemomyces frigidus]|uniref:Uncharacterized protein n=1 Tax=Meristemomyces frigidus TaxID=1508187 RepID=A0AAN7YGD9_9PEZI|nr:hypothetical protein LTR62_001305 [Meristemomyces frigidus]
MAAQPDLQAILAALSQYVPPPGNPQHILPTPPPTTDVYLPPSTSLPQQQPQDPRVRPQTRTTTPKPKPMIDPATITTWQEGLRCVTKIAASNAAFASSIKRVSFRSTKPPSVLTNGPIFGDERLNSLSFAQMMDLQRKHEIQWYSERQALKQSQISRVGAAARAQSILLSLGTSAAAPEANQQTDAEKAAELAGFDRKVFAAQVKMDEGMGAELKGLGVPFFGTKAEVVRADPLPGQSGVEYANMGDSVSQSELLALKRKMVQHLEDLYRD